MNQKGDKMRLLIEKEEHVKHTRVPQNKTIDKELKNTIDGMSPIWARKDGYFILTFDLDKKEEEEGFLDPIWEEQEALTKEAEIKLIGLFNRGTNRGLPRTMGVKIRIIGHRASTPMITNLSNVLYIDEAGIGEPLGHGYLGFVILKQARVDIDSKRLDGQTIKRWAQQIHEKSVYSHVEQLDINSMKYPVHEEEAKIIMNLAPEMCEKHNVKMVKIDNLNLKDKEIFLTQLAKRCQCPVEMKKHFDGPGGVIAKREYNLEFGQEIASVVGSKSCSGKSQAIKNFLQNSDIDLIEKNYGIYVKINIAKSLIKSRKITVQNVRKDYKTKVELIIKSRFWL